MSLQRKYNLEIKIKEHEQVSNVNKNFKMKNDKILDFKFDFNDNGNHYYDT